MVWKSISLLGLHIYFLSFNKLFRVAVVAGKGRGLAWTIFEFFLSLLVVFGAAWMRFSSL